MKAAGWPGTWLDLHYVSAEQAKSPWKQEAFIPEVNLLALIKKTLDSLKGEAKLKQWLLSNKLTYNLRKHKLKSSFEKMSYQIIVHSE